MTSSTAGIAQLKARLSEYLARVRAGGEVVVTDHGRPVAKLVPASSENATLVELEREGLVRTGSMKIGKDFLDSARPAITGPDVTEALIEERREGR
ncbi:MAG: type II toxin-antitoxin system Phd/YefM family antitoxin [Solirubrobacterales bacterium]